MKKRLHFLLTLILSWTLTAQVADNFDSYSSGDDPTGWTKYQTETDDPGFVVTDAESHSAPNSLYHNDDNVSSESTSWIVAPVYTSTGNDLLTLYYRQNYTASYYNYSGVWYSTTGADPTQNPGDWTEIVEFNDSHPLSPGYSEDTWTQFSYTFNVPSGTTIYVAFKYVGDWEHEFYIDDFSLDAAPSCIDPNNLSATSTSLTEAELSWNENGTATQWNIEYGPEGFTQGSGTTITGVTNNPYTLSGLTAGQQYDFYVQADCGSNGTSNWVGPFTWQQIDYGDNCDVAISLNVESDCSSATPYTLDFADAVDLGHFTCDQYGSNNGKWFSFAAPTSGKVKLISSTSGGEFVLLDACGGNEIYCDDAGTEYELLNLTAGQTYYLAYWKDGATSGTVDICLQEMLYLDPEFTATPVPDCNNNQFSIDVNVTDLGGASSVTVSDDQGSATQSLSAPGTVTFGPYASGTSVTITVTNDDDNNYANSDTVNYTCPPANDECANGIVVPSLPYSHSMDASGATNNNGFIDCNGNGMNDGVWYILHVATASGDITVDVTPNGWDAEIGVYSGDYNGGACSNLTCVARSDSAGSGGSESVTFTPSDDTYYFINIGYYSSSRDEAEGPFDITISGSVTLNNMVLSANEFVFYPNPTESMLYFNANHTVDKLEVVNISGQVLISQTGLNASGSMDISALRPGVYMLNVYVEGKKGTFRIIKK
jgi:hypothetical protein